MKILHYDAVAVGSGCAGYNCADRLFELGVKNIALLTEGRLCGTSRNTGSDKQTYYKLSLAGDGADSVLLMAQTLFEGGAMDGDIALCEAANSTRCFLKLAGLGVPFPTNEYGEYVGYKTDHDPGCRATSIGPYTSKKMTEVLENAVCAKGIPVLDCMQVVKILTENGRAVGLLALDLSNLDRAELVAIETPNILLATGGPAALYKNSVYPESQTGSSALALFAGAAMQNLSEWQYGLASTDFRWNVSGTYQQVLPKYISVDEQGVEREFLLPYFKNSSEMLQNVFLKGYQWPFDVRKIGGSSFVDLLVYRETELLGRRVYMDFRTDPTGLEEGFSSLDETSCRYLANSDALLKTPIARLEKMNPGAISLYKEHGIDLYNEPLRVAVCAQHHNGGIGVDANWQTNIEGLYAAGEAAGTFGVFRPGGSALNSTQVGSMRAAEHIRYREKSAPCADFEKLANAAAEELLKWADSMRENFSSLIEVRGRYQGEMSRSFAFLRNPADMKTSFAKMEEWEKNFERENKWSKPFELGQLFKNREILAMSKAVASAMIYAAEQYGSRGSAMVTEGQDILHPTPKKENEQGRNEVLMTAQKGKDCVSFARPVRPIPNRELWFEKVWGQYRKKTER